MTLKLCKINRERCTNNAKPGNGRVLFKAYVCDLDRVRIFSNKRCVLITTC
jgi:hypothetical protein